MLEKQIRQVGFAQQVQKRIQNERPSFVISDSDLHYLIRAIFIEIACQLRMGNRVIIENLISFFTKPIKRKCRDFSEDGNEWDTYNRRIRIKCQPEFKAIAEVKMTEEDYENTKKHKETSS